MFRSRQVRNNTTQLLLSIEQDGPEIYKVHGSQLETVGAKLRGKPHFIVPFTLAALTALFAATFQVVNWSNTVAVEDAGDATERALKITQEVTAAIGRRHYATLTFIPALRDFVRPNEPVHPGTVVWPLPEEHTPAPAGTAAAPGGSGPVSPEMWVSRADHPGTFKKPGAPAEVPMTVAAPSPRPDGVAATLAGITVASPASRTAQATRDRIPKATPLAPKLVASGPEGVTPDVVSENAAAVMAQAHLDELDIALKKQRFESYYASLKEWNENIDQKLTDVHYALDKMIFEDAGQPEKLTHQGFVKFYNTMRGTDSNGRTTHAKRIDCLHSPSPPNFARELELIGLTGDSLKMRLAGIHFCFMELNTILDEAKSKKRPWTPALYTEIVQRHGKIRELASEMNCLSLHRVDYYRAKRERSFINPASIVSAWRGGVGQAARSHFKNAMQKCSGIEQSS